MKVVEHHKIENPLYDQCQAIYDPKEDTLHILDKESLYFSHFEEQRLKAERKDHFAMKLLLNFQNSTLATRILVCVFIPSLVATIYFKVWLSYAVLASFGILIALLSYEQHIIDKQLKKAMNGR